MWKRAAESIYERYIENRGPPRPKILNGVATMEAYLTDTKFVDESYEDVLIDGIRSTVEPGDEVVEIGGGIGVSGVVAALCTTNSGHVTIYEASPTQASTIEETLSLNKVNQWVTLIDRPVGSVSESSARRYGYDGADTVNPSDLPHCDVLILDCEGAEQEIIEAYTHRPRSIIAEVHPTKGADKGDLVKLLENREYTVSGIGEEGYKGIETFRADR